MISPGAFNPDLHYYEKVKNKQQHHEVKTFLSYTINTLIDKYTDKYKSINKHALENLLTYQPKHFFWSGVDLYHLDNDEMLVLETNSCPSGQKSMPSDANPGHGYMKLMQQFLDLARTKSQVAGALAVIYDKNHMEVSGYAKQLANVANEPVHFVEISEKENPHITWTPEGVLHLITKDTPTPTPIRAAFRYVTQKPWSKIPIKTQTFIFNPVIACLAGGRNKLVASKAYDDFNNKYSHTGIKIRIPNTLCDVDFESIDTIVTSMNYCAVIKIPYSNAGQGVFIIHNRQELQEFLANAKNYSYEKFIIQELVSPKGTTPDISGNSYICDLRFMTYYNGTNPVPLIMYARKAKSPYVKGSNTSGHDMYLTNLSEKTTAGWHTHSERLILLDIEEYPTLNMNIANLVDAYFQSVFATIAIDMMADKLYDDGFNIELFKTLNDDPSLLAEIL